MKPFNLEKFLEGEPAEARSGEKIAWFAYDEGAKNGYRLTVRLCTSRISMRYRDEGRCSEYVDPAFDLVMSEINSTPNTVDAIKLCKDCKYCEELDYDDICTNPSLLVDYVHGINTKFKEMRIYPDAQETRIYGACGVEGKYWEPK